MIASIHFCKSARAAYDYDSKREVASHAVLLDNSFGRACTREETIRNLELVAGQNDDPRVSKKYAHISLSFSPDWKLLSYQLLALISKYYLYEMGYEGCPYVLHLHKDRPHPHVHAVVTRVNMEGALTASKHDRYRSKEICRQIEKELNLLPVESKRAGVRMDHREKHAAIYQYDLNIFEVRKRIDECRSKSYSWREFVEAAKGKEVDVRIRGNREGVTYEIKVDDEKGGRKDFIVSGSRLGRDYMLRQLDPYFEEREVTKIGSTIEGVIAGKPATTSDFDSQLAERGITVDASDYWKIKISKLPEGTSLEGDQIPKKLLSQIRDEVSRLRQAEEKRQKEALGRLRENVCQVVWLEQPTDESSLTSKLATWGISMKRDDKEVLFRDQSSNAEVKSTEMDPNFNKVLFYLLDNPHQLWQVEALRTMERERLEELEIKKKKREKWEQEYRSRIDPDVTQVKLNALWRKIEEDEAWGEFDKRKEEQRLKREKDPFSGGVLPQEVLERRRKEQIHRGWSDIPDSLRNPDPDEEQTRGRERGLGLGR